MAFERGEHYNVNSKNEISVGGHDFGRTPILVFDWGKFHVIKWPGHNYTATRSSGQVYFETHFFLVEVENRQAYVPEVRAFTVLKKIKEEKPGNKWRGMILTFGEIAGVKDIFFPKTERFFEGRLIAGTFSGILQHINHKISVVSCPKNNSLIEDHVHIECSNCGIVIVDFIKK